MGLTLIWMQNTYKIIRLAGDVYQIDHLPMKLTSTDFLLDRRRHAGALVPRHDHRPRAGAGALAPVDVLSYE